MTALSGRGNSKTIGVTELVSKINENKIESIEINQDTLVAKEKNSDTKLSTTIGRNTQIPQYFKDVGIDQDKINHLQISFKNSSVASTIAGAVLPFLVPFVLIALFIYFLMRQVQGTNNRALTFGQSSVRLSDERKNKVRFADVAGYTSFSAA